MTRRGLSRFTDSTRVAPSAPPSVDTHAGHDARNDDAPMAPTLARVLSSRPRPQPGEACELCSAPVADGHRHVVDLERRSLLCACRSCALLFDSTGGDARYRAVPDRYMRVDPFVLPPAAWTALQIPVGMAFIVANSQLERTVAFYPSPAGATESELPLAAWDEIVAANPPLTGVEADVEAVLLHTGTDTPLCAVVPVDRCYELVGALRLHWRGFDGGAEVRERIAAFFADVAERCTRSGRVMEGRHRHSGPLTRPPSKVLRDGHAPPPDDTGTTAPRSGDATGEQPTGAEQR